MCCRSMAPSTSLGLYVSTILPEPTDSSVDSTLRPSGHNATPTGPSSFPSALDLKRQVCRTKSLIRVRTRTGLLLMLNIRSPAPTARQTPRPTRQASSTSSTTATRDSPSPSKFCNVIKWTFTAVGEQGKKVGWYWHAYLGARSRRGLQTPEAIEPRARQHPGQPEEPRALRQRPYESK